MSERACRSAGVPIWLAALMLALPGCGATVPDEARETAAAFVVAYVDSGDPRRAMGLAAAAAADDLAAELRLLGPPPIVPPVVRSRGRLGPPELLNQGRLIKYRVRVLVPPPPGAARGTPPGTRVLEIFLEPWAGAAGRAWRVTAYRLG